MALSVLIVDDSRVSRQIVRRGLPEWNLDVREAAGGREGLDMYRERRADIVLLDLTMPDMSGFETLESLMKLDPEARVLIITADVQSGSRERVRTLGGLALLPKPVQKQDLLPFMEDLLND